MSDPWSPYPIGRIEPESKPPSWYRRNERRKLRQEAYETTKVFERPEHDAGDEDKALHCKCHCACLWCGHDFDCPRLGT